MLLIPSSQDLAKMVPHNTLYWAGKEINVSNCIEVYTIYIARGNFKTIFTIKLAIFQGGRISQIVNST